ncbi:MAG: nucleotide exchange factor GrpE [Deltaproteobacteria bacterium]|nr:nucleotide exchange factor GrpE [Deltaproteobacteria bacterium]
MLDQLRIDIIAIQRSLVESSLANAALEKNSHDTMQKVLLGVIDLIDLVDSISSMPPNQGQEDLKAALAKIKRRILKVLGQCQVSEITFGNQQPVSSEARIVATKPCAEMADGDMIEVIRKGYRWNDLVLRYAEVIVAKN